MAQMNQTPYPPQYTGQSQQTAYPLQYTGQNQQTYVNNPQNQINSQRIWTKGEGFVNSYMVANNTEQIFWDSEEPVIYIKTVDNIGRSSVKVLDYTVREPKPEYNPEKEMDILKSEINDLKSMMQQMMANQRSYKQNYNKKGGEEQ